MKLLLPSAKNLRIVYSYLLLKGLENGGVVSYQDIEDAVAVAGIAPTKAQIKKFLLMLTNHQPKLIEFYKAGIFAQYYKVIPYIIYEDENEPLRAGMGEVNVLKSDLLLILSDESSDGTITMDRYLVEKKMQEGGAWSR